MKKPALTCLAILFSCFLQFANAQTGVNAVSTANLGSDASSSQIDGISFTPDGILRTTESGGTKSIKNIPAPVVTKKPELLAVEEHSAIEKMSPLQYKYAMLLNVDVESLKNISLLAFIDNWFGTRYSYG